MCRLYAESTLNHTNFQKLLMSEATFDLIIIEAMFNEAHTGIGAPVIMLSTIGSNWMVNKYVANPAPGSMVPDAFLGFPSTHVLRAAAIEHCRHVGHGPVSSVLPAPSAE
ncbi:UDP-glycosyltransferase family 302 member E1 [Carabus blaptoides fortunei]